MLLELYSVVEIAGETLLKIVPITIGIALVFTALNYWTGKSARLWWRKREIVTDVLYWFLIPLMARFVRIGLLVVGAALIFNIHGTEPLIAFYTNGHGPLSELPLWAQVCIFLVASDFLLYWIHRGFHGVHLWKYHAVHHSSEDLEWISAARFHPVNIFLGTVAVDVTLLLAGISPEVMVVVGPFTIAYSAFVHANLDWTFGPFKYLLASPVFHRWHHTAADEGGSKNFASTFPVLDWMFGTFHMPENELPQRFGIDDREFPEGFGSQMAYPFRR